MWCILWSFVNSHRWKEWFKCMDLVQRKCCHCSMGSVWDATCLIRSEDHHHHHHRHDCIVTVSVLMTIFFPIFSQTMCNDHEFLTMPQISRCLFPNRFWYVLITSQVSWVCLKMWHTPKSQLDLGKVTGKVTPPQKKKSTWGSLASDILQPRTGTARQDSAMVLWDHQEGKSSVFGGSGFGSKIQILGMYLSGAVCSDFWSGLGSMEVQFQRTNKLHGKRHQKTPRVVRFHRWKWHFSFDINDTLATWFLGHIHYME